MSEPRISIHWGSNRWFLYNWDEPNPDEIIYEVPTNIEPISCEFVVVNFGSIPPYAN